MDELCIVPGEKVWGVMIDIHVLSDGGNIFDALASQPSRFRTALFLRNDLTLVRSYAQGQRNANHGFLQRAGGRFVYDPSEEEELGGDERIHITLGDEGHLHSLQKGLKESSLRTNLPRF